MSDTETFLSATTFGVAGASSNRSKYGNKAESPDFESLSIITPPIVTEQIVDDAIAAGVKHLWMQPGAESEAAIEKAKAAGLTVISGGPCVLVVLGFREE
jgi:hypothetical protein